jgi:hypothetical protein
MAKQMKLGKEYYLAEPNPEDAAFIEFWAPLEPDLNTRRRYYRHEFLRAFERVDETQIVLSRLRDDVLPHYDDSWGGEQKADCLRGLNSLQLAEQCRETLSPYGVKLLEVLEQYNLMADWVLQAAIWTVTSWATSLTEGNDIQLSWEWTPFDTEEHDTYGLDLDSYVRYRPPPLIIAGSHENEESDEAFRKRTLDEIDAWLEARKQAREAQDGSQHPARVLCPSTQNIPSDIKCLRKARQKSLSYIGSS